MKKFAIQLGAAVLVTMAVGTAVAGGYPQTSAPQTKQYCC